MPRRLQTPRLTLRPFRPDDAARAFELFECHPEVWKHDPGYARTFAEREEIILGYARSNDANGVGGLAIVERASKCLIGYVGLQMMILPDVERATAEVELFYKLGYDYWGMGYAQEACAEMLRFAFEELRIWRVVAMTHRENHRSLKLLERLGMIASESDYFPDFIVAQLS
jgi:RimJ/RimL family protein N-acetyltransferase